MFQKFRRSALSNKKKSIHVTGDTRTRQEEYGGVLRLLTTHPTFAVEFKLPDFLLQLS